MKDPKLVRELISENIPLHKVLEEVGIHLPQVLKPQQMSCPFHGKDVKQSARYYPETNSMYCFTCKKSWDPISFWMEYSSGKFMESARRLANVYRVDLSKIADIQAVHIAKYKRGGTASVVDRRRMALSVLETNLRLVLPIEAPEAAGKMLYIMAMARTIDDPKHFAQIATPLAQRITTALA